MPSRACRLPDTVPASVRKEQYSSLQMTGLLPLRLHPKASDGDGSYPLACA